MTAPLTPSDCDLQDFPFMPLHVARLRDSDLANEEAPEACWYAVLLWAVSWHQLPAGSLPDSDELLTRLIGLGRDVRTFRKHKAAAMRGFVKCDDGRLYHPVVAEQVVEAWERKRQQRWRSELARIKKANQRNGTTLPSPTYEQFIAGVSPDPIDPGPDGVPGDTIERPPGQTLQETETGTGTGTGTARKEAIASSVAGSDAKLAFDDWNALAARLALPIARDLTAGRRKAINARLAEAGLAGWREALAAVEASPHCRGENDRGWRADIDFLATAAKFQRLREGSFGKGAAHGSPAPAKAAYNGPAALRLNVVKALGEEFAAGWIDPCTWQEEGRVLVCRNAFVLAKLKHELGHKLETWGVTLGVGHANSNTQPETAVA